jgi:mutator protein MutT
VNQLAHEAAGFVAGPGPNPAREERTPVDVAVGVLLAADGQFLLTSRPAGKVFAGYWEFPGGKLEAGESVAQALARELHEELGIQIGAVQPWRVEIMDYPHARVRLHFCKVYDWQGQLEMREHQSMAWQNLPVQVVPVLPGTVPVLAWLAEERGFEGSTHGATHHHAADGVTNVTESAPKLNHMDWIEAVKWDAQGLVPVIAQEVGSNDVLMFAFMNRQALAKTAEIGEAVYFSRSRQRLWHKGEESGNVQKVHEMRLDCDRDVVLLKIEQLGRAAHEAGIACHTGRHSCFFQLLKDGVWTTVEPVLQDPKTIYK